MNLEELYSLFLKHPLVCTDTRKLENGCLFFALKGGNFNGNTFASKALEAGAAYAIIDEANYPEDKRCILVKDVLETLQQLAAHHRKQLGIPVIAIVGSNGKTTSKELISAVLQQKFALLSTPGNFNNHIGLPLTLLMLNKTHELAVIEMGANHEKENAFLCEIAQPTHGLVTNNGKDHLEGFGSLEGVIRSNAELYVYLNENRGMAFVNAADPVLMQGSKGLKRITYSSSKAIEANYIANPEQLQPAIGFECNGHHFCSNLSGDYNLDNIMAALAIGFEFGLTPQQVADGIASYKPRNLRSEYLVTEHNRIFLDAYNANPSSMQASIRNFHAMEGNEKLYVLGDMFEMGAYEAEEHQALVDYCVNLGLKNVWLVGEAFSKTQNQYKSFKSTADVIAHLDAMPLKQHFVFLKGSRGMKLESLVNHL